MQEQQMMVDSYCAPSQCMVNSCVQSARTQNYAVPYTGESVFQPVIPQPYDLQQQVVCPLYVFKSFFVLCEVSLASLCSHSFNSEGFP